MATLHAKHITFGNYGIVSGDFGSESLSRTQLAKHALSNLSVALNLLPKSNWNLSELLKEASKLSLINHPNVAKLAEFSSTAMFNCFIKEQLLAFYTLTKVDLSKSDVNVEV